MADDDLEGELAATNEALARSDLRHAAHHLGGALGLAPLEPRVTAAIDALAARCDLTSVARADEAFYGEVALHAHGLQRAGRLDQAVALLAQVAATAPHLGFEVVLARWLAPLRAAQGRLGPDAAGHVARLLSAVSESTIGLHRLWPGERALLEGYGELAVACASCEPDVPLAGAASGLLRRLGRSDLALALADRAQDHPVFGEIQRGLALRAAGDGAAAAAAFERAATKDPERAGMHRLEQARCWLVAGDHARARALLARVPASDDPETVALRRACEGPPTGDGVAVLDDIRRRARAPSVAAPTDATVNLLRQVASEAADTTLERMAISGWESPSNRLLFALYASGTVDVTRAEYVLDAPALTPDPSSYRRGQAATPWLLRDGVLVPAAPPTDELRRQVAELAAGDESIGAVWARAAALAARLGPGRGPEVARALVNPPEDDAFRATLPDGLYRHQLAGACVLAALPDEWSVKRPLFEAIVFGPVDWVSRAAILALSELAVREAGPARDVRALLLDVIGDLLPHSCEPRFGALVDALARLPASPPHAMQRLRAWHEAHEAPGGHGEDGDGEVEGDGDGDDDAAARSTVGARGRAAAEAARPIWPVALVVLAALIVVGLLVSR